MVDEGVMDTDVKTRVDDQVQVITTVGSRYKAAEDHAMTLETDIKSLEATASKAKRLMDSAAKAQLTAKAAKERARLLAEHMTAAVSAEAGKMESGAPEPRDAADSVVTALKTMEAARAATLALEALDKSLRASREVCALTAARISDKKRELGVITKDKEAYHGLLAEEVHVGNALLDIMNGNRPGKKTGNKDSSTTSVLLKTQPPTSVATAPPKQIPDPKSSRPMVAEGEDIEPAAKGTEPASEGAEPAAEATEEAMFAMVSEAAAAATTAAAREVVSKGPSTYDLAAT